MGTSHERTMHIRGALVCHLLLCLGVCLARRPAPCGGKEDDPQATEGASARDCYAIIGVDSSAEKSDIKRAYRKLALKYHPDKHKDPDTKELMQKEFVLLAHAYDVLSNKREQYDAGELRVEDDDDWRDFNRASQTYSNSGIEDNIYSWTVFFAIAAMPVAAFIHREWSWWSRKNRKAKREQQRIEDAADKAEKTRQSELKAAAAPRVKRVDAKAEAMANRTKTLQAEADLAARKALAEEQRSVAALNIGTKDKSQVDQQRGEWTTEELGKLAKALARHPGGTLDRWIKISEYVVTRNESEVKAMAGVIRSHGGKLPKSASGFAAWEPPNKLEPKGTVAVESQVDEWSLNQQKALEAALKKYPASDKERWDHVAADVGKTRKQVIKRCKELRDKLKK